MLWAALLLSLRCITTLVLYYNIDCELLQKKTIRRGTLFGSPMSSSVLLASDSDDNALFNL